MIPALPPKRRRPAHHRLPPPASRLRTSASASASTSTPADRRPSLDDVTRATALPEHWREPADNGVTDDALVLRRRSGAMTWVVVGVLAIMLGVIGWMLVRDAERDSTAPQTALPDLLDVAPGPIARPGAVAVPIVPKKPSTSRGVKPNPHPSAAPSRSSGQPSGKRGEAGAKSSEKEPKRGAMDGKEASPRPSGPAPWTIDDVLNTPSAPSTPSPPAPNAP